MRQGDLSFKKANFKFSDKAKQLSPESELVLKHGESGNKHMLKPVGNAKVTFEQVMGKMYFEVKNGKAILKHSKDIKTADDKTVHKVQIFEEGLHALQEEEEYNPFTKTLEIVVD